MKRREFLGNVAASSLLAGPAVSRLLAAEAENRRIENPRRLQSSRDNAYSLFERQWSNAMSWVERREDVTYTGPEMMIIIADIDALISDVLDGMESL